jgi:D-alanyl-D-alanine carboxypeptidase
VRRLLALLALAVLVVPMRALAAAPRVDAAAYLVVDARTGQVIAA